MSRKITEIMADAFFSGKNKKLSNTEVKDGTMYLFGNRIAWIYENTLYFTLCGWNTATTKERLRGLGVHLESKKGKLYFNDEEINDYSVYEMKI